MLDVAFTQYELYCRQGDLDLQPLPPPALPTEIRMDPQPGRRCMQAGRQAGSQAHADRYMYAGRQQCACRQRMQAGSSMLRQAGGDAVSQAHTGRQEMQASAAANLPPLACLYGGVASAEVCMQANMENDL
eukprot:1139667-Pelagomonas_calceolata.AAC.2